MSYWRACVCNSRPLPQTNLRALRSRSLRPSAVRPRPPPTQGGQMECAALVSVLRSLYNQHVWFPRAQRRHYMPGEAVAETLILRCPSPIAGGAS